MNAERIERLAIDRALGELNEDAAVLFAAYLAEHPEAQEWAKGMSDTCAQTRKAIDRRTQDKNMENPSARTGSHWSPRVHWVRVGRWAALVAVSVGIGVTLGRWSRSPAPPAGYAAAQAGTVASASDGWQQVLSSQGQGFWQSKALALLQATPYEIPGSRDPQASLWDKYKQFRKERSHE
jgi:hypothetical protein